MRRQIPATPRTYILGGHDHDIEWVEDDKEVYVMKNLANAETVRVILLLAGGKSVASEVFRAYERLQAREHAASGKTLQYPEDLEAVLVPASDTDSSKVMRDRIKNAEPAAGYDDLYWAVMQAQSEPDIVTFKLRYEDHEAAAPDDAAYVEEALKVVARQDDDVPVCDLSDLIGNTAKLEARDAYIRRRSTNLGVFVAECVRLEAGAHVAIINSGAFRCDSELDAKLSVRDLRETFLYDKPNAIMVLEVDSNEVTALIEHGNQPAKNGTGAFPQIADERNGATGAAQPGRRDQHQHRAVPESRRGGQHRGHLTGVEIAGLGAFDRRSLHAGGRVVGDQLVGLRVVEDGSQDGVDLTPRAVGQTAIALAGKRRGNGETRQSHRPLRGGRAKANGGKRRMTDDAEELVVVELAAAAVRDDSRELRIVVTRLLDYTATVPLSLVYRVAERVRDIYALNLNTAITTNGSTPHDN